ncbi:MAG: type II toxin-antitoxin system HicB family antitoxin [Oscillospiraceae bacterium]|nr:type II toxin-antitoxin system HicB family antitoxin [Oscillospiraceae bacterium]
MRNSMNYKGYYGSVEFSDEDNVFFGRIIGINDRITYEGDNVQTLRRDFEEAVEDYLEICAQMGKEPEKAYKGTFNIRIAPTLHRNLAIFSASHGKTLNATVEEAIREYIN